MSHTAIFLKKKKSLKIMYNKELKTNVFIKDFGDYTEEQEEKWLE